MILKFVPAVIRQTVFKMFLFQLMNLFHQHRKDAFMKKRYSVFIRL